jgi:hypothetical protein
MKHDVIAQRKVIFIGCSQLQPPERFAKNNRRFIDVRARAVVAEIQRLNDAFVQP